MRTQSIVFVRPLLMLCLACCWILTPRAQPGPPQGDFPPDGPPPQGFPGPGPGSGGFGMMQQEIKVRKKFDKDKNGLLDASERKAAREYLKAERAAGRGSGRGFGPPGGRRFMGGPRGDEAPPRPGPKLSPADVKSVSDAPLYDSLTLRTFFLEFEDADWEKELEDFHNTDADVPAKLIVDGKVYPDVGVHFRGMSSYGGVSSGHKRSLNLTLDYVHKGQNIGGYRTLNLLNAHEDPTFLRPVLFLDIARDYLPAAKANFARVVINGESWGIYDNVQQFNKDFVHEWFGTTQGARWKVRGSPGGQGRLTWLGDDPAEYKRIYTIKTKDDPAVWAQFIKMCKVLNETPPEKLEEALSPLLDIDGALRFIALDNALVNNDGYWIRTSDYSIYQDVKGRFHIIPADVNETFVRPGGPGFGGMRGPRPENLLSEQMLAQGDRNKDQQLTRDELEALANNWFTKLDADKEGKVGEDQFTARFGDLMPPPSGPDGNGPANGRFFGPRVPGRGLFKAVDSDKDGVLTRAELKRSFEKWSREWDTDKSGSLNQQKLAAGLASALPPPDFIRGGPPGMRRGPGGPPGMANMPQVKGVELDPLVASNDPNKPLISKLLAVPSLRPRYLDYVRDIAEKWLDWKKLGPIAESYHKLIAEDVRSDTRKLDSTEDFEKGLLTDVEGNGFGPFGRGSISLKNFADQRREFLLKYTEKPQLSK